MRKSKMGRWRAAVLIAVHLVIAAHIVQWLITGMTVTPVEPSESMYTINDGAVNAGFVFFGLAIMSTLVLGRFFCGWGCHVVALQDLCSWAMKKVGVKPKPFRSRLLLWAPLVLAVYMFAWPTIKREIIRPVLGKEAWAVVAPHLGEAGERPEIRAAFMTEHFWETFPPWYVAVPFLALCGFGCVYFLGSKGFCTYGCPYGGIFGPADRVAVGRIRVTDACEHCGHCTAVCTSNVRVHEEVRDYGMVMDPGCMKCMDCVSVCPNEALYFGFGKPAIGARPRAAAAPAKFKTRVYDLSWEGEVALGAVFLVLVIGFRGWLGMVPLLMAMGIAGIGTFLVWKLWSMIRLPNVRVQSVQLKLKGFVKPAGWLMGAGAAAILVAGVWGAVVNASLWRGRSLDAGIATPLEEVLTAGFSAGKADRELAGRAAAHLRRAGPVSEGGIGWDRTPDRALRLARLEAMRGNLAQAERDLRSGLLSSADSKHGPSAPIEDSMIRVLMLRAAGSPEAFERSLRELASQHKGLGTTRLSLAQLALSRGEESETIRLIEEGVAAKPGDARNVGFATDLLRRINRLDLAVKIAEQAVQASPKSAEVRARLGLLLAASGRMTEGIEELKRAAEIDPRSADIARHIAALLREAGRNPEAEVWERRASEEAKGNQR